MADEDNIVEFRAAAPSARLKNLDWQDKRARCRHKRVEIWRKEPILECTDCGAVVDAHQWIRDRCQDWAQVMSNLKFKKQEIEAEIGELKKARRILRKKYKDDREKRDAERALMHMPPQRRA
jgi:hypothetical protein